MQRLLAANRVDAGRTKLDFITFVLLDDFPCFELSNLWNDTRRADSIRTRRTNFTPFKPPKYCVQRCLVMTTEPGDLVLDTTCGSGTSAYVAEQWGRRWITIDTSRVPLALARQRLLTATFPGMSYKTTYAVLPEDSFTRAGEIEEARKLAELFRTLRWNPSPIMNHPKKKCSLTDPEVHTSITRVTGPFCFEATIPTPLDFEESKA